jgi:hypothetical protein
MSQIYSVYPGISRKRPTHIPELHPQRANVTVAQHVNQLNLRTRRRGTSEHCTGKIRCNIRDAVSRPGWILVCMCWPDGHFRVVRLRIAGWDVVLVIAMLGEPANILGRSDDWLALPNTLSRGLWLVCILKVVSIFHLEEVGRSINGLLDHLCISDVIIAVAAAEAATVLLERACRVHATIVSVDRVVVPGMILQFSFSSDPPATDTNNHTHTHTHTHTSLASWSSCLSH